MYTPKGGRNVTTDEVVRRLIGLWILQDPEDYHFATMKDMSETEEVL